MPSQLWLLNNTNILSSYKLDHIDRIRSTAYHCKKINHYTVILSILQSSDIASFEKLAGHNLGPAYLALLLMMEHITCMNYNNKG